MKSNRTQLIESGKHLIQLFNEAQRPSNPATPIPPIDQRPGFHLDKINDTTFFSLGLFTEMLHKVTVSRTSHPSITFDHQGLPQIRLNQDCLNNLKQAERFPVLADIPLLEFDLDQESYDSIAMKIKIATQIKSCNHQPLQVIIHRQNLDALLEWLPQFLKKSMQHCQTLWDEDPVTSGLIPKTTGLESSASKKKTRATPRRPQKTKNTRKGHSAMAFKQGFLLQQNPTKTPSLNTINRNPTAVTTPHALGSKNTEQLTQEFSQLSAAATDHSTNVLEQSASKTTHSGQPTAQQLQQLAQEFGMQCGVSSNHSMTFFRTPQSETEQAWQLESAGSIIALQERLDQTPSLHLDAFELKQPQGNP